MSVTARKTNRIEIAIRISVNYNDLK